MQLPARIPFLCRFLTPVLPDLMAGTGKGANSNARTSIRVQISVCLIACLFIFYMSMSEGGFGGRRCLFFTLSELWSHHVWLSPLVQLFYIFLNPYEQLTFAVTMESSEIQVCFVSFYSVCESLFLLLILFCKCSSVRSSNNWKVLHSQ